MRRIAFFVLTASSVILFAASALASDICHLGC